MTEHTYDTLRYEDEWLDESEPTPAAEHRLEEPHATPEEQIVYDALEAARPRFEHLAEQLAQDYPYKRWDIVIGDDASGRLPALFVGSLVNKWRHDDGEPPARRVFIGGGRVKGETFYHAQKAGLLHRPMEQDAYDEFAQEVSGKEQAVGETIDTLLPGAGERQERALVVTEHIEFGHTLKRIGEALDQRGIDFDIAAFNTSDDADIIERRLRDGDLANTPMSLYIGEDNIPTDVTFKPNQATKAGEIFRNSFGVVRDGVVGVERDPDADQKLMRAARQKIAEIVQDCYEQYPAAEDEDPTLDDEYYYPYQDAGSYDAYRQNVPQHDPDHPDRAVRIVSQDKW